ncbi:MAG: Cation acetate symporter [Pseudonocardia sp.]|uniref:solute symporter family protein n=1 Tax=Pseudonocardia sp. TaxID=60912 RepID=UPI0026313901|nr:cation acetate symporter [Pseudonocardia sp.]MCU1629081.1 Cation acetate symporter [Pseudonocardia sp.]
MTLLAAGTAVGSPGLNLGIFAGFVALTFVVLFATARGGHRAAGDYYTGGQAFTAAQNGTAIAGDYLSAAAFLGVVGAVAVYGFDGVMFAIGSLTGWVIALLFIAEPLRNTGRYTMADVLSYRLRVRPVRSAAATSTLLVSMLYLVAQIAGAGGLLTLLLGIPNSDRVDQSVVIAGVGVLMLVYVLVGGMKGTTWVQILKAVLLAVSGALLAVWVLGRWGFNLSSLLQSTMTANSAGEALLNPGLQYGRTELSKIDFLSLGLAGLLGPASLPHVLMRFYTVPDGRAARRSVVWAIWLIGLFFLAAIVIGYGAAALVGPDAITAAAGESNAAAPLLAYKLGGEVLLGVVAAIAFATILAVVAGLTITASASFAHDVYATVLKRGNADPRVEVRVARFTAVVVGIIAIAGGIVANGQNIAVLVGLTFAVAASAHLPSLLYTLYWPRFTTTGAVLSIWGGMITALVLVAFSPEVSGTPTSLFPDHDFAWFPLANPGMVSIPVSFLLGAVGTWLGGRRRDPDAARRHAEMEVRALTGANVDRPRPRSRATTAAQRYAR